MHIYITGFFFRLHGEAPKFPSHAPKSTTLTENSSKTHQGVPESLWKPQKSKDQKILHRICTLTFFQTQKKMWSIEKKGSKKISKKKSSKNKIWFSPKKKFDRKIDFSSSKNFRKKCQKKYFLDFFSISKKYFLVLTKFFGHSFDAEKWDLSISEVFMTIPALLVELSSKKYFRFFDFFLIFSDFWDFWLFWVILVILELFWGILTKNRWIWPHKLYFRVF